jgi:hypothetical protein
MVEATTALNILRNVRVEGLAFGSNPIDNGTFHALSIICPCTVYTFLNLFKRVGK